METESLTLNQKTTDQASNLAWLEKSILGLILLRLIFLLVSPLDLISDEAYYWDWSRHLDWCYFSKPPMIAWVNRLSTELFGNHVLALRGTALLLATCSLWFMYDLTRMMYGKKLALLTVLLLMLTPGHIAQSTLITIDAPFLCCFMGALWAGWKWSTQPQFNLSLVCMMFFITAGILSKQTMLAFLPLFFLFLLLTPALRSKLFSSAAILLVGSLLLAVTPIIIWNSEHNWITFQHTATHFQVDANTHSLINTVLTNLNAFIEFQASQFFLMSPMLWLGMSFTFIAMLKNYRRWNQQETYLACFSLIPLLGILLLSMRQSLEPNWGAAFYPAGIILFVAQLERLCSTPLQIDFSNTFKRYTLNTGILCTMICYVTTIAINLTPLSGTQFDFTNRLKGWQSLAQEVAKILPADTTLHDYQFISTTGRGIISELAFYLPSQPHIRRFNATNVIDSQYDIWGLAHNSLNYKTIIISDHTKPLNSHLTNQFAVVTHLGTTKPNPNSPHSYSIDLWLAVPHANPTSNPTSQITLTDTPVGK